jgi:hypothetical protein
VCIIRICSAAFRRRTRVQKPHYFSPQQGKPVLGETGIPSDLFISYLAEKSRGGAAQVTVGDTVVDPEYGGDAGRP